MFKELVLSFALSTCIGVSSIVQKNNYVQEEENTQYICRVSRSLINISSLMTEITNYEHANTFSFNGKNDVVFECYYANNFVDTLDSSLLNCYSVNNVRGVDSIIDYCFSSDEYFLTINNVTYNVAPFYKIKSGQYWLQSYFMIENAYDFKVYFAYAFNSYSFFANNIPNNYFYLVNLYGEYNNSVYSFKFDQNTFSGNSSYSVVALNLYPNDDYFYTQFVNYFGGVDDYNLGYQVGYDNGNNDGQSIGYQDGFEDGESYGYNEGLETHTDETLTSLFLTIADTPILMLRSMFDFDVLGLSLFALLISVMSILLIVWIIKKVIH